MTKWHVERAEGTKIKDEGGNTVLWTQHTHLRGRRTDEEVMQIARLAAAAPELLAALGDLADAVRNAGYAVLHTALIEALDNADRAIAKAEAAP